MTREPYLTKSQIAYSAIKEDIVTGKYKPNQRIVVSRVAKQFGFSEIPVREALKQLESEGIIQSRPHVGVVVTSFEFDDYEKLMQVRAPLEGLATRLAAENLKERDLHFLEKLIAKMEKVINDQNFEKLPPLDREFHQAIYRACGNTYLNKIINEIWDLSFRNPGIFAFIPERARKSLPEHQKILQALKNRDGELAEKLILKQKEDSRKAFRQVFNEK